MRILLIVLASIFSLNIFAQGFNPFDEYLFDENYTIVGLSTNKTLSRRYKNLSFILKDTSSMNALKKSWKFDKPVSFRFHESYFQVYILKNKEIIKSFSISPEGMAIAGRDNQGFYFDKMLLLNPHSDHPLDFYQSDHNFQSKDKATLFADSVSKVKSSIFSIMPPRLSNFEGEFFMTFPKGSKIPDFKIATKEALVKLGQIAPKSEFIAFFSIGNYQVGQDSFRVTANSSRKIYDRLKENGFKKGAWKKAEWEVIAFWEGKDTIQNGRQEPQEISYLDDSESDLKYLDSEPEFPGGINAFRQYLAQAYKSPEQATKAGIFGIVPIRFIIEKNGKVGGVEIINDLGFGISKEITRILLASPKWKPGKFLGENARVRYSMDFNVGVLPAVKNDSSLPSAQARPAKLSNLEYSKGKYYFTNTISTCSAIDFEYEEGLQALSDRFSILGYAMKSLPKDSLSKISGRLSYQVLIDTTGKCCVLSFKNETNVEANSLAVVHESIASKSYWNLLPPKSGRRKAVSALLVFTFSPDLVKYQHYTLSNFSGQMTELEYAQKTKQGSKW